MPKDPRADPGQPLRTTRVTPATPPLVSVIFLSFNANHLLRRAVQSVWEQAYSPIEIVIVDNASTDGTAAELAGYEDGATVV
ncbi:MAG: glycosyltransferase, partial [Chloroflexota bacterium]|nr:glycosyltransferase [Chloroflexota bacterium]